MYRIRTTVHRDLLADTTVIDAFGILSLANARTVRSKLSDCVAECPSVVVVDLARCRTRMPATLAIMMALAYHRLPRRPSVRVMLCGVSAGLRGLTRFVNPRVSAYRSRQDALMAASKAKSAQPCLHLRLARSLTAPAMARDATRKVCASWDLAALSGPAQLVVSELITNAVVHTEGDVELEIALRDGYFLVRVHDASFVGPVLGQESIDHGRGLRLVGHYSTAWGFSIGGDGKVVWAALRTPRGAARAAAFAGT